MNLPFFIKILILAIVQGLAELLPVSSSAHVIVAEKLMGLDPTKPEMTLLLVMLHTGTMFAVILYFWKAWKKTFFASSEGYMQYARRLALATVMTLVVGVPIILAIEKGAEKFGHLEKADIESLFGNLGLVSAALMSASVLILIAGLLERSKARNRDVGNREAVWIGAVQGLCLPFRGFSRSGATISTGMLLGAAKSKVEEFSFALAVIITPAVIVRQVLRLIKAHSATGHLEMSMDLFGPSLAGMVFAFLAGLLALKWLSGWLESGRWYLFGIYCAVASVGVAILHQYGY